MIITSKNPSKNRFFFLPFFALFSPREFRSIPGQLVPKNFVPYHFIWHDFILLFSLAMLNPSSPQNGISASKKHFAKLHSAVSFRIDVSKRKVKNDQGPTDLGSSWPYIFIMKFTRFTQELSKIRGIESSRPCYHSSQLCRFRTYIKFDSMAPITRGLPNAPPFDVIVFVFWTIFQEKKLSYSGLSEKLSHVLSLHAGLLLSIASGADCENLE